MTNNASRVGDIDIPEDVAAAARVILESNILDTIHVDQLSAEENNTDATPRGNAIKVLKLTNAVSSQDIAKETLAVLAGSL